VGHVTCHVTFRDLHATRAHLSVSQTKRTLSCRRDDAGSLRQAEAHPAHHVARGQASYFGSGARPKGPRAEVVFLGRGQPAPSPPARGSGSAVSYTAAVSGAELRPLRGFLAFKRRQMASPATCWGKVRGKRERGMASLLPVNPRAAVGTEFLSPYPSHTHRKSRGYPHRIPIPTEPQNPTYPYTHPVFSLQEAYFNLLFVTLTVGYYMMYVHCESVCD